MAEFVVLLRKEIKDGLTRQGMQKNWQKGEKRGKYLFLREHTNKS